MPYTPVNDLNLYYEAHGEGPPPAARGRRSTSAWRRTPRTARLGREARDAPRPAVQREPQRLLEVLADLREELRGVGAVEDAVVAGERELHHRAHDDLAVADHGPRLERADGEDRRLRRVDHRDEALDAVHAEVGDGERAARELGRGDRAGADPLGDRARLAGDLADRLGVGVEHGRHHERVLAGDRDADVDARVELELAVAVGAVGAREVAQRERARLDHEVVERRRGLLAGGGLELPAQLDGLLHVDLDVEHEVRRRGLGLRHPPGDRLLQAREVLVGDVPAAALAVLLARGDRGRDVLLLVLGGGRLLLRGGLLLLRRRLGLRRSRCHRPWRRPRRRPSRSARPARCPSAVPARRPSRAPSASRPARP